MLNAFRTHTIILVDDQDNVSYYERNLQIPTDPANMIWKDKVFEFKLHK